MVLEEFQHPALIVFAAFTCLQLLLFLMVFYRSLFFRTREKKDHDPIPVSVIITAKDEEDNLKAHLPFFLDQDYPDFEVIVVNDQSVDNTEDVLDSLTRQHENLQVVRIGQKLRKWPGKKLAVSLGIRRARHKHLLLSDADCRPVSDQWISTMMSNYREGVDLVLGVSPYVWKKSLLNKIIQFDTLLTLMNFTGFTLAKMPYMGIGRNLSYTKSIFEKTGFGSQLHVPYGDDDLFVNESATKRNVVMELSPASLVLSKPKDRFGQWFRQKYRHLSAGKSYRFRHKLVLTLSAITFPGFFVSAAVCLILLTPGYLVFGLLALRYLVTLILFGILAKRFSRTRIIFWVPFLELFFYLLLLPYFSVYLTFKGAQKGW